MNNKLKSFEKNLKKLNELKSTYKSLSYKLIIGEKILKETYLKIVLLKDSIKLDQRSPESLKELKEKTLKQINSKIYQDPNQKIEEIELISKFHDINYLKEQMKKNQKKTRELERDLNEISDKRMRLRKKIRLIEKKIGVEESKYDDKYMNLI